MGRNAPYRFHWNFIFTLAAFLGVTAYPHATSAEPIFNFPADTNSAINLSSLWQTDATYCSINHHRDLDELSNQRWTELIVLTLPNGYKWVSVTLSALDPDSGGRKENYDHGIIWGDANGIPNVGYDRFTGTNLADTLIEKFESDDDELYTITSHSLSRLDNTGATSLIIQPYNWRNPRHKNDNYLVATAIVTKANEAHQEKITVDFSDGTLGILGSVLNNFGEAESFSGLKVSALYWNSNTKSWDPAPLVRRDEDEAHFGLGVWSDDGRRCAYSQYGNLYALGGYVSGSSRDNTLIQKFINDVHEPQISTDVSGLSRDNTLIQELINDAYEPQISTDAFLVHLDHADMMRLLLQSYDWHNNNDLVVTETKTFGQDQTTQMISLNQLGAHNEIPEPTTLVIFGTGLLGIAAVRRRRRKAKA